MISIFINILIFTLIFVFILILKQQIFISSNKIENFKNNKGNKKEDNLDDDDTNETFILAQQNAGNINVLKDKVGHLEALKNQVMNNSNKLKLLEDELEEILQEQTNIASHKTPSDIFQLK